MKYLVIEAGEGWSVRDDEQAVFSAPSFDEALATAKILALAVKAAGGRSSVAVQDRVGTLRSYDLSAF